jgi:hypothetical protein
MFLRVLSSKILAKFYLSDLVFWLGGHAGARYLALVGFAQRSPPLRF